MKHFLALFLLLAACFSGASAQTIKHHAFITHYNAGKGEPDSVSWMLTPAMVSCGSITRKDKFARDPEIANSTSPNDYKKSGYDKGHLFPFADAQCDSVDRVECFL